MAIIRTFIPGSEWLYFKIYTGVKTADSLLKMELHQWIEELLDKELIDKWFFTRYQDPDFHIRVRIHLNDTKDFSQVFCSFYRIFNAYIASDVIWKIQCDTYQREMERYGVNSIHLIEDLFFVDSQSLLSLFRLDNTANEQLRWNLSLVLIDNLLSTFSYEIDSRKDLLKTLADNFKREFGVVNKQAKKQLDRKWRFHRRTIETVMSPGGLSDDYNRIIRERSRRMYPIVQEIIRMDIAGELHMPLNDLLSSMIHMTMNRWFRTKNRMYELVIYEFISKFYISEIARNKS